MTFWLKPPEPKPETVSYTHLAADKTDDPQKPWMGEGKRVEGISGALPYDAKGYTVREDPSTTPEGYRPCPDWTIGVDAMADGASLHYIVDNDLITSRIQVVKADAESGQTVPLAGFSFQLLDKDLKPITPVSYTHLDVYKRQCPSRMPAFASVNSIS